MQQLWECPKCAVIVKVSEVLPPVVIDAERMIERKLLTCRVKGLDKIMRRFRLGLPFFRLGCWLADMDLEVEEAIESQPSSVVWMEPLLLCESGDVVSPATFDELNAELEYRNYQQMEEYANRLAEIARWYASEKERLAHMEEEAQ